MSVNEDILDDDPGALAVEFDDAGQYEPESDSAVVIIEPKIIAIGRKRRKDAVRKMSQESGNN